MRGPSMTQAGWLARWAGVYLPVLLVALIGCSEDHNGRGPAVAQPEVSVADSQAKEHALRERAQVSWEAKRIHDEVTVYRMRAESLSGQSVTLQQHYDSRSKLLPLLGFTIRDVQINGDRAKVRLEAVEGLEFFGKTNPIKREVEEPWVLINGEWYQGGPPPADAAK